MTDAIFLYLLKATLCLLVFSMVYRWFLSSFTHFRWMRFYLIGSVVLSMVLPLLQIPALAAFSVFPLPAVSSSVDYLNFDTSLLAVQNTSSSPESTLQRQPFNLVLAGSYLFASVYLLGFLVKISSTTRNLRRIRQFIVRNDKVKEGNYYLVYLSQKLPAFSFWHFIFLNQDFYQLRAEEQQQIKAHEMVHVRQKHTLDLLFFEIAGALFWFNPLMGYLKKALREVHEYLADAGVTKKGVEQKAYAHLLLKLAVQPRLVPLVNSISGKQISRRIVMLTKARSLPVQKFTFLLIFPLAVVLLLLNACMDEPEVAAHENEMQEQTSTLVDGKKIRRIIWEGNTVYDDAALGRTFGLKPGDVYNEEILKKHLYYNSQDTDVATLYMDQGYLFFSIDVEEKQVNREENDLVFNVFEGQIVKVDNIIIKGNQTVPTSEIRAQIPIESGDIFNRSKLIEAQKAIAAMGYFDPEQVGINPYPHWSDQEGNVLEKMELEFTVIEINPK